MESKPTKAATFDPGWNDPPPLSFASQIGTPPKQRTTLNKRLAFPVQPLTTPLQNVHHAHGLVCGDKPTILLPTSSAPVNLLPTNVAPTNVAPPNILPASSLAVDNNLSPTVDLPSGSKVNKSDSNNIQNQQILNSNEMCSHVIDFLYAILANNSELGSKVKDIQKRIDTLHSQWQKGQLNEDVQIKMFEMVEALKQRNIPDADIIHQCLVVDHISSVSSWIPAIRQLIHHLQAKEELLSIDSIEDSIAS